LEDVSDILAELASVQLHAIQTSGNCIRNTTSDEYAGVAKDEIEDPRPYCELIRQWSTFHPEFAFLPRKFKIAVNGAVSDRAAVHAHDIGVELQRNARGEVGFRILVGGGLGRTPVVGLEIRPWLAKKHLLSYLEAILRVYNLRGRRDNKFKARIKILVKAMGIDAFREAVDAEWQKLRDGPTTLTDEAIAQAQSYFTAPPYEALDVEAAQQRCAIAADADPRFARWYSQNTREHRIAGYRIVDVSLKAIATPPGDISDVQMELVADLADRYAFGEIRSTHQQNLVLADVRVDQLFEVWQALETAQLASPTMGLLTDIVCCPGGDYCSLANARSIPLSEAIQRRFDNLDYLHDLGPIDLNISGCMNACGHHHIGHIGILGVDKKGEEFFQISLGGSQNGKASIGEILGPSFGAEEVPAVIEQILQLYLEQRESAEESFLDTYRRIGIQPFKERIYANRH
jgi:sulfite reductase (NADPH) hemoprotein beta-component